MATSHVVPERRCRAATRSRSTPTTASTCASITATMLFDLKGAFDDRGTPNDFTDDKPRGTPLPCTVRESSTRRRRLQHRRAGHRLRQRRASDGKAQPLTVSRVAEDRRAVARGRRVARHRPAHGLRRDAGHRQRAVRRDAGHRRRARVRALAVRALRHHLRRARRRRRAGRRVVLAGRRQRARQRRPARLPGRQLHDEHAADAPRRRRRCGPRRPRASKAIYRAPIRTAAAGARSAPRTSSSRSRARTGSSWAGTRRARRSSTSPRTPTGRSTSRRPAGSRRRTRTPGPRTSSRSQRNPDGTFTYWGATGDGILPGAGPQRDRRLQGDAAGAAEAARRDAAGHAGVPGQRRPRAGERVDRAVRADGGLPGRARAAARARAGVLVPGPAPRRRPGRPAHVRLPRPAAVPVADADVPLERPGARAARRLLPRPVPGDGAERPRRAAPGRAAARSAGAGACSRASSAATRAGSCARSRSARRRSGARCGWRSSCRGRRRWTSRSAAARGSCAACAGSAYRSGTRRLTLRGLRRGSYTVRLVARRTGRTTTATLSTAAVLAQRAATAPGRSRGRHRRRACCGGAAHRQGRAAHDGPRAARAVRLPAPRRACGRGRCSSSRSGAATSPASSSTWPTRSEVAGREARRAAARARGARPGRPRRPRARGWRREYCSTFARALQLVLPPSGRAREDRAVGRARPARRSTASG